MEVGELKEKYDDLHKGVERVGEQAKVPKSSANHHDQIETQPARFEPSL